VGPSLVEAVEVGRADTEPRKAERVVQDETGYYQDTEEQHPEDLHEVRARSIDPRPEDDPSPHVQSLAVGQAGLSSRSGRSALL
jgi:hypothetical protein